MCLHLEWPLIAQGSALQIVVRGSSVRGSSVRGPLDQAFRSNDKLLSFIAFGMAR